jgi:6-phosphogluconolactonase
MMAFIASCKMYKINIFNTTNELNEAVVSFIQLISKEKSRFSISLSGGSTPKALFDYWAKKEQNPEFWAKTKLFWGDERCVPPDDEMSNYGMTKQHLLDKVPIAKGNIFRIHGEENAEKESVRYGQLIDKESTPFDLIILGLGDDGHTVSIFPPSIDLWESPETCIVNYHPESGMPRITITGKVINAATHVIFLVTGAHKVEKVRDIVLHREEFAARYPAARVNPASENLYWFLDKAAAALLNH